MASPIDTNVLVYRFYTRDPVKQQLARDLLRSGLANDSLVLSHQTVLEFVAVVIQPRPDPGRRAVSVTGGSFSGSGIRVGPVPDHLSGV